MAARLKQEQVESVGHWVGRPIDTTRGQGVVRIWRKDEAQEDERVGASRRSSNG